jgi:hypothetical protein
MKHHSLLVSGLALLFSACGPTDPVPQNTQLGIAEFKLAETASGLHIAGVGAGGATVGELDLRIGIVNVPELGQVALGREIVLRVGTAEYIFPSGGLDPLYLPAPDESALSAFVLDPFVNDQLRNWHVAYVHLQEWLGGGGGASSGRGDETAYAACYRPTGECATCADYTAPCGGAGARSTCEDWAGWGQWPVQWQQLVECNNDTRAIRMCTNPFQSTQCGTAGPNGCAPCGASWTGPVGGNVGCYGFCQWVDPGSGGGGGGGGGNCSNDNCNRLPCCSGECDVSGQCLLVPI